MIGALLAAASPAAGQAPTAAQGPVGILDDPCVGAPQVTEPVRAYIRSLVDPAAPKPAAMPVAELTAYRAAGEASKARDWPAFCRYRADNARIAASGERPDAVYLGDSLTELWGIADPAFFTGGRVNRGISGQTTAQMLLRFQADVVALRPRVVHIMAGTNDIAGNTGAQTMADVQNMFAAMTTLARANGIRVVLASIPPAVAFPWRPEIKPDPQIRALNAWLRDHARRIGATYVDYHAALASPEGALPPALTFDGVHMNLAGYRRIETLSRDAIRR